MTLAAVIAATAALATWAATGSTTLAVATAALAAVATLLATA